MAVPAVGLGASVLWAGETVNLAAAAGFALILGGVAAGLLSTSPDPIGAQMP